MKKQFDDRNAKYYIENICPQFPNIQIIYIADYIVVIVKRIARSTNIFQKTIRSSIFILKTIYSELYSKVYCHLKMDSGM